MIVREDGGDLLLIGQTDHSRLVGQFCAHWGNEKFAAPKPFESMAREATYHDYGWLRYETSPIITDNGNTPGFREIPGTPEQLASFQWCIDWLTDIDHHAGLIASMHRTGLWRQRYGVISHPAPPPPRTLSDATEKFVAANEKAQEKARKTYGKGEVWTNYHLMQVWDLLGLYFCCQDPTEDYIEPVPTEYGDDRKAGVRMNMSPQGPRTVFFDPYPFSGDGGVEVQLTWKRLKRKSWSDQAAFRKDYFQAPTELVTFELLPA